MNTSGWRGRVWPTIVIAVLAGNLLLGITLMRVAAADEHFAVEPDYYRRAVGWDSTQAQARATVALGWRVHAALGPVTGAPLLLTLVLTDAAGRPLAGATVTVEGREVAYATNLVGGALPATASPGAYAAPVAITRAGLWELTVRATRGSERIVTALRLDARTDGPAQPVDRRPGAADPARVAAGMRPE